MCNDPPDTAAQVVFVRPRDIEGRLEANAKHFKKEQAIHNRINEYEETQHCRLV